MKAEDLRSQVDEIRGKVSAALSSPIEFVNFGQFIEKASYILEKS